MDEELDLAAIKSRSVKGIVTLTGGGLIATGISILGTLIITAILGPAEFGIYGLVLSVVVILNYFSDIGLAASLIQKKDKITTADLRTTFTIQESLVLLILTLTLVLSNYISSYYNFSQTQLQLFYALLISFFLSSLKSIPSVILERELRFDKIILVRIFETLVFNLTAVAMALNNFGALSFGIALILQNLTGIILYYFFKPWPIGLQISKENLKHLLKFGVPFQLNSLIAVAKDQFVNLFLFKIVGASGMGLFSWGFNYSQMPQRLIMDNATKVAFPALSRMQDNSEQLKKSIEKLLQFVCLLIFPMLIGISLAWSHLVFLVDRWQQWQGGLLPLYLLCFSAAMSCLSTPLTNTLYALGKPKIVSYLMLMWLVLEWLLKPYFATQYGFLGIAIAAAIISFSSLVPFFLTQKLTQFNISTSLKVPVFSSLFMLILGVISHSLGIYINLFLAGTGYLLSLYFIGNKKLLADIKPFYDQIFHNTSR